MSATGKTTLDEPRSLSLENLKPGDILSEPKTGEKFRVLELKEIKTVQPCKVCQKFSQFNKICGRCLGVFYCDQDCQSLSWKDDHKELCRKTPRAQQGQMRIAILESLQDPGKKREISDYQKSGWFLG